MTQAKPSPSATTLPEFSITRTLNAPLSTVWEAWTNPERFPQWFGPKGFTCRVEKFELKVGGTAHSYLRSPDGIEMWGKFIYREITPKTRLAWQHSFADKEGNIVRHPFSTTWPLTLLTVITFDEKDGKTTLHLTWTPYNASEAEQQTFAEGMDSMKQGWTGTFDQLEAYLASQAN